MGKTNYKGLRIDYQPGQKVKVMLGRDWFDAEVVKANKKSVVVNTLFSKTKYRRVPIKLEDIAGAGKAGILAAAIAATTQVPGGLGTVLEPYTVRGTKIVKLARVRVKPIESRPGREELASRHLQQCESDEEPEMVEDTPPPEPEYEGPGLGKDEAPLFDYKPEPTNVREFIAATADEPKAEAKPETAADVLAELEKLIG